MEQDLRHVARKCTFVSLKVGFEDQLPFFGSSARGGIYDVVELGDILEEGFGILPV
jgi:hypothetical protein